MNCLASIGLVLNSLHFVLASAMPKFSIVLSKSALLVFLGEYKRNWVYLTLKTYFCYTFLE
jgi:hypothetical protein